MLNNFLKASKESARNPLALILEALRLKLSLNQLQMSEYIDFKLYLNDISYLEKKQFGGKVIQKVLEEILIDEYSKIICHDKVTMYALMKGLEFPIPELKASYNCLRPSSLPIINNEAELENYLSTPDNLPVYAKRSFGCYGKDNTLIKSYSNGMLEFGNNTQEKLKSFVSNLNDGNPFGWIFQIPLKSHEQIKDLTNSDKISGLRIHSFLSSDKVTITKAVFKVNIGDRDTDNFEHGFTGNLAAAVDLQTGKVIRAISGTGLNQKLHTTHPITNKNILGFEIPYWKETISLIINLQKSYPGIICPGWDIAICDHGPVVIEINTFGDLPISQHAYREGFLSSQFQALMKERGLWKLIKTIKPRTKNKNTGRIGARRSHWKW